MINHLQVSYNDFQLGDIIHPDEFDVNNADIQIRVNQIIDVLNQITDGVNGSGASIIDIGEIAPFFSPKLQEFLEQLVAKLTSTGDMDSGAHFIGSQPIPGIDGDTVHEQLTSLTQFFQNLQQTLTNEVARVDGRIDQANNNHTALSSRVTLTENSITNLSVEKADREEVYSKEDTDTLLQQLRESVNEESYTKEEVDGLLDEKLTKGENHTGKWQGIDLSDLAGVIGARGVHIDTNEPSSPVHGMLWYNPTTNEYRLYLNGTWRITGRLVRYAQTHNRVVLEAKTDTVPIGITGFDRTLDLLNVYVNSTYRAPNYDYVVNANNTVTFSTELEEGTVIDFDAHIVTELE